MISQNIGKYLLAMYFVQFAKVDVVGPNPIARSNLLSDIKHL